MTKCRARTRGSRTVTRPIMRSSGTVETCAAQSPVTASITNIGMVKDSTVLLAVHVVGVERLPNSSYWSVTSSNRMGCLCPEPLLPWVWKAARAWSISDMARPPFLPGALPPRIGTSFGKVMRSGWPCGPCCWRAPRPRPCPPCLPPRAAEGPPGEPPCLPSSPPRPRPGGLLLLRPCLRLRVWPFFSAFLAL